MQKEMTSDSHPIRVDIVKFEKLDLPGKLGLTFAPGKKQASGMSGCWNRDLDEDLRRLRELYKTDVLVSLIEEHEFENLKIHALRERAKDFSIENLWFPVRDQSVPDSMEQFSSLIQEIIDRLAAGKNLVIHCMGGLGRTGLVAAACLVAYTGISSGEAIEITRRARSRAVENSLQERFVAAFADFYGDSRRGS